MKYIRLSHYNKEERDKIRQVCSEYCDIFYSFTNKITHKINTKNENPIYVKTYQYPEGHKDEVTLHIHSTRLEFTVIKS